MRKLWLFGLLCVAPTLSAQAPFREYKTNLNTRYVGKVNELLFLKSIFSGRKLEALKTTVIFSSLPYEHLAYVKGDLILKCGSREVHAYFFISPDARSAPVKEDEMIRDGYHPVSLIHAFTILNTDLGDEIVQGAVKYLYPVVPEICDQKSGSPYFAVSLWMDSAETHARGGFEPLTKARFDELVANSH